MDQDYKSKVTMDPSGFVVLAEYIPGIVQEIRYYSTYNFVGDRIDGYEEPGLRSLTKTSAIITALMNSLSILRDGDLLSKRNDPKTCSPKQCRDDWLWHGILLQPFFFK